MSRYLAKRLITVVITLFGVSLMTFTIARLLPGDPARVAAGPTASAADVETLRREMGLDQPIVLQYVNYLQGLTRLDLGRSIITRRAVRDDLVQRFPATLELIFVAFFLYLVIGIPLGIISALAAGKWTDFGVRTFSVVGYAIPLFVTALWLQYFLYFQLGWFPAGERLPVIVSPPPRVTGFYLVDSLLAGNPALFSASLRHITLPALALALGLIAVATRFTRASMLTELGKDYVKMGHLKGLKKADVVVRHALRNSLIPVVTITAIQFGYLVGGSVLVEAIFLWPGVGFYAYNSVLNLDYAPIMGVTLVTSFIFVMTNLFIDLLYPVLDPRIKLAGR